MNWQCLATQIRLSLVGCCWPNLRGIWECLNWQPKKLDGECRCRQDEGGGSPYMHRLKATPRRSLKCRSIPAAKSAFTELYAPSTAADIRIPESLKRKCKVP